MVDVGGGTLDVTVFNVLSRQNEDDVVYPVLARSVALLGTRFLVRWRWRDAGPGCDPPSPFRNLPSELETAALLGKTVDQLRRDDQPFYKGVVCCIGKTIQKAAKMGGVSWPARLFLVGGGASVELYQRAVRKYECDKNWYELEGIKLPRPENLEMARCGGMKWHRLAVAYGLSFDPDDIGRIIPPEDIEPVRRSYWKQPYVPPRWI